MQDDLCSFAPYIQVWGVGLVLIAGMILWVLTLERTRGGGGGGGGCLPPPSEVFLSFFLDEISAADDFISCSFILCMHLFLGQV